LRGAACAGAHKAAVDALLRNADARAATQTHAALEVVLTPVAASAEGEEGAGSERVRAEHLNASPRCVPS